MPEKRCAVCHRPIDTGATVRGFYSPAPGAPGTIADMHPGCVPDDGDGAEPEEDDAVDMTDAMSIDNPYEQDAHVNGER